MEESDRQKIITNLIQLIKIQNTNIFYTELIARNVFSPDMLENILSERRNPREQIQKVFLEICKRGPDAFQNLIEALRRSGNISEAILLDPNGNYEEEPPIVLDDDENLVPVGIHYFVNESSGSSSTTPTTTTTTNTENVHYWIQTYKITSQPRGFALIINVIDFDGNPNLKRIGAEMDSTNLQCLLEKIGYKVEVVINPRKKNLLCKKDGILKCFTERFSIKTVDSCIVAIMSHGEDNFWIQTSDCESMEDDHSHLVNLWDDIFPRFNNQHFPMMRNKPKIFIIQSCRGDRLHKRIRVSPVIKYNNNNNGTNLLKTDFGKRSISSEIFYENHPEFNHMMILQSTIPGYVSLRHEELGSPFIQIVCQSIELYGHDLYWVDLVNEIAKKLQDLPPEDGGPQTCTYKTIGYVKKFIFNTK